MTILEDRLKLLEKIKIIPEGEIKPSYIRELKIYKGQAGICRDETGLAISLLNTGKHYPDDIFDGGLLYHYPETDRKGSHDLNEIESTKECKNQNIPIFIISPGNSISTRKVKLGWVIESDDKTKMFLIEYGENQSSQESITEELILIEKRSSKKSLVKSRPNQGKFRFNLFKKYGSKCAVCNIDNKFLLDAAHIIPKENNGSDDWRNGLILCKNHHSAFDRNLFKFDEDNFSIIEIENGLNITETNLKTLTGLLPHQDAFKYRYNS